MNKILSWYGLLVLFVSSQGLDDWALVDKYCPIPSPTNGAMGTRSEARERFYIYRDHPVYEQSLKQAFGSTLGGSKHRQEKDSEYFGEVELFCELLKHPSRTWEAEEATLFIIPAFPYLLKEATEEVAAQLITEPTWQRSKGTDHLVVCTHWACTSRLGSLFYTVALPGYLAALERNIKVSLVGNDKWLDPRIYRIDMDQKYDRIAPTPLYRQIQTQPDQVFKDADDDHPLCPERIVVLPYPPHMGIVNCRHIPSRQEDIKRQEGGDAMQNRRRLRVSFAGTLRMKICGPEVLECSHGVRRSITTEGLLSRYNSSRLGMGASRIGGGGGGGGVVGGGSDIGGSSEPGTIPQVSVSNEEELSNLLDQRAFYIRMFTSQQGGRRQGEVGHADHQSKHYEPKSYQGMLQDSHFCIHLRGDTPTSRRFYDSIAAGCLPIVVSDALLSHNREGGVAAGANLPFRLGGRINYTSWVTFIKEADWTADPLGELDKVMERFFFVNRNETAMAGNSVPAHHSAEPDLNSSSSSSSSTSLPWWSPKPVVEEMRQAMALDAPRLTLCSGTGAVGDEMLADVFERMERRREEGNDGKGQGGDARQNYVQNASIADVPLKPPNSPLPRSCFANNAKHLSDFYVVVPKTLSATQASTTPPIETEGGDVEATIAAAESQGAIEKWFEVQEELYGHNHTWCTEVTAPFQDYQRKGGSGNSIIENEYLVHVA